MSAGNIIVRDSTLTGNSPTVQGFLDRLLTPPIAPRETLYATLIDSLVAAGIWAILDALYIFAAADQGTAFTNLISDTYRATWPVGACTFTANRGFTPNGASAYVDTGFNPSSATNYQRDSACYFVWNLAAAVSAGVFDTPNQTISNQVQPHRTSGGHTLWRINTSNEDDAGAVTSDATGLFVVNRTASNASSVDHNGSTVGSSATASQTLINANIICDTDTTAQLAVVGFGASLNNTQLGQIYSALLAYMQGVGAA
jgi:hypothetical protein